jgi:SNF2 family DNA or RNA helicase
VSSKLLLRQAAPPAFSWLADAVPLAYEEAGRQQFGAMPGIVWVKDRKAPNGRGFYRGPREAVEMVAALLESAGVVHVSSDLPPAPYGFGVARPECGWPDGFRDYQQHGAAWCAYMLRTEGGALLADEMGIGKTAQALAAAAALGVASAVVVAPAITRSGWLKQHARWAPGLHLEVYSYEAFTKIMKAAPLPAGLLIVDEMHYASNPKSQRSKALAAWRAAFPGAPILGLTGTPMTAEPRDLWHPLNLLWPGRFGTRWAFEKRYCDGRFVEIPNAQKTVWSADGVSRAEELASRLARVMLRRTKASVALELPPRERVIVEVEIPKAAQRSLARAAAALGSERQGVSSLLSNIEEHKIEQAIELAEGARRNGERVLLLTTRRETAAILGTRLNAPHADGSDSVAARERLLANAPVAVATLYSVGTGVDYLSGFSTLIMVGLDWLPSVVLQGESRVHRIGQVNPVTVYYLIGRGTLDEVVRERVIERLDTFATLTGGDASDGFSATLGGGTEEELLASIVAAVAA